MNDKQMMREIVKDFQNKENLTYLKTKIRSFVQDGFDLNTKYFKGRTLAHYAVKYNVVGIIPFMARLGQNVDLCDDAFDTPLHMAVKNNRLLITKDLIKAHANLNLGCEFEETALHLAVAENHKEVLLILLAAGADATLVDENNLTPLDYALTEENEEIIKILKTKKKR